MSLFKGFGIIILPAFAGGSALALYDKFQEIISLFVWLVADGWCWFVLREKYC
jgi:hypothetical protein